MAEYVSKRAADVVEGDVVKFHEARYRVTSDPWQDENTPDWFSFWWQEIDDQGPDHVAEIMTVSPRERFHWVEV
jgi:hypothetical protein